MSGPFCELDRARVVRSVKTDDGEEVLPGTCGTVVFVHFVNGFPAAYEVEFSAGLATVDAADLIWD